MSRIYLTGQQSHDIKALREELPKAQKDQGEELCVYVRPTKSQSGATFFVEPRSSATMTQESKKYLEQKFEVPSGSFEKADNGFFILTKSAFSQHLGLAGGNQGAQDAGQNGAAQPQQNQPQVQPQQVQMVEVRLNGHTKMVKLPPTHTGKPADANIPKVPVKETLAHFIQNVKQWAAHGIIDENSIIDNTANLDQEEQLLFRCYMNMDADVCDNILQVGSVSGKHRDGNEPLSEKLQQAKEDFNATYNDANSFPDLVTKAGLHKDNGHGESNFVGTTSDPEYTYGQYSQAYSGKYVFAIAVKPSDDDKVYAVGQMDDMYAVLHGGKHMHGMGTKNEEKAGDFEKEFLFGGGIPADRIVCGVKIRLTNIDQGNLFPKVNVAKSDVPKNQSESAKLKGELEDLQAKLKEKEVESKEVVSDFKSAGRILEMKHLTQQIEGKKNQLKERLSQAEQKRLGVINQLEAIPTLKERIALMEDKNKLDEEIKLLRSLDFVNGDDKTVEDSKLKQILKGSGEFKAGEEVEGDDGKTYKCLEVLAGGAHGAYLFVDKDKGNEGDRFVWKPSLTSAGAADLMMQDAEVSSTKLANFVVGSNLVPEARKLAFKGTAGTAQPFSESNGETLHPSQVQGKLVGQMVAHMIGDWMISNHDNNSGQFLINTDGDLIGFDKGQGFKHFREGDVKSTVVKQAEELLKDNPNSARHKSAIEPEHIDPDYHPSGNFKKPATSDFMQAVKKGDIKVNLDDPAIEETLKRCESLTTDSVKLMLEPYAKQAFPGKEDAFYQAVVDRGLRMRKDIESLFSKNSSSE